jgi:hypothetical protein
LTTAQTTKSHFRHRFARPAERYTASLAEISNRLETRTYTLVHYSAETESGAFGSPVIAHDDLCAVMLQSGTCGCEHPDDSVNLGTAVADMGRPAPNSNGGENRASRHRPLDEDVRV